MLSLGMLAALHLRRTIRNRGFMPESAPPSFTAIVISLLNFEKILPRLASIAPLKCLTFAHLLCPAIVSVFQFAGVCASTPTPFSHAGTRLRSVLQDPLTPAC